MSFKGTLLFFSFALPFLPEARGAIAAPSAKEVNEDKANVFRMKHQLEEQTRQIQQLSKEVNNVEVTLGLNNKKYLALAEERAKIEESLARTKKSADGNDQSLKKYYNQTKNLLMGVLLNKLEDTENPSDLLARKIMSDKLKHRLVELEGLMKANKGSQKEVELLYQKLELSMQTEKELLTLMSELEIKKRDLKNALAEETKSHGEKKIRFDEEKNKLAITDRAQKKVKERESLAPMQVTEEIKIPSQLAAGLKFSPPLYNYHGLEYQKKGVTFNFQGKNEVRATKAGKIVYTGPLANYGNVLMIHHGNDTRTILLGQFDYTVKNGDEVKEAQVIGYTNSKSQNGLAEGKLYFEVRKNNLAQNTYLLLDKKWLANNLSH